VEAIHCGGDVGGDDRNNTTCISYNFAGTEQMVEICLEMPV